MRAIILNSGTGSRLGNLTESVPKGMVKVGGEPILGRQLRSFAKAGVVDIIITTGPHPEKIRSYVTKEFPNLRFTFVHNEIYKETNYIYTLMLTRKHVNDDMIIIHGDMVFDTQLLRELIANKNPNVTQVNLNAPLPEKDFKGRIVDGIVTEIGVKVSGKGATFLMPVYKLSKKGYLLWLDHMDEAFAAGNHKIYPEDLLPNIADKLRMVPHHFEGICQEIDDHEDLALVEKLLREA